MSAQLSPTPVFKGWANDGTPLAYGLLTTWAAGTTTPIATYIDSTQSTPNTNPIVLNARGECALWLVSEVAYKINLTDAAGNQIPGFPVDNIIGPLTQAQFDAYLTASAPFITAQSNITTLQRGLNDLDNIQAVVAAVAAGTSQLIWCEGDSTMVGNTSGGGAAVPIPAPAFLQNTVNTWMNNAALTVINNGLGGTSLNDMITGVNGYTQTFAARIAVTNAVMVFCNHGLNDAYGHSGTTTAAVYRANLITFIQLCRQYSKIPVLITTHPVVSIGSFGSLMGFAAAPAWTQLTAQFSQIMRDVAAQHGVTLIDTYKWWALTLGTDNQVSGANANTPLNWFPDGVHGTQATYAQDGLNMVDALLGGQVDTLISDMQTIGASRSNANGKTVSLSPSATSRYGASFGDTNATAVIKILFRIGAPGLDLSLLHPVLTGFSASIAVQLDGTSIFTLSQGTSSWAGGNFLQDYETQIQRNVNPGFHMLILTTSDAKPVAFHALRARRNNRPIVTGAASATVYTRQLLSSSESLQGASNNEVVVFSNYPPMPFYIEGCQMEWTGTMPKSTAVGLGGYYGNNSTAAVAQQTIAVGLNASGFLTVTEATLAGTYNTTVLDAADHSGGSHTYAFFIVLSTIAASTISCFIDGSAVGGATSLTQGYSGGNPCMWKLTAGAILPITNWSIIWTS